MFDEIVVNTDHQAKNNGRHTEPASLTESKSVGHEAPESNVKWRLDKVKRKNIYCRS